MTREEKEHIGKYILEVAKSLEDGCYQQEIFLGAAHIIDEALEQEEPRWIPVSEKLPEKNMDCLVAVGEFNFTEIAGYSDLMGIIDHKIFHQGEVGHDSFKNITKYVKAWMPLPRDYMEDKNGTRKD